MKELHCGYTQRGCTLKLPSPFIFLSAQSWSYRWSYKTTHHHPQSFSVCRPVQRTHVERNQLWPDVWVAVGFCNLQSNQQGKRLGSPSVISPGPAVAPVRSGSLQNSRDEWSRAPVHLLTFACYHFVCMLLLLMMMMMVMKVGV